MALPPRARATLFDKLVSGNDMEGLIDQGEGRVTSVSRETMRTYAVPKVERFNEEALRVTVRREIAWLLNTTQLGAAVDLEPYPHVQTSVLNYGVPDLAGRAITRRIIVQRARDVRNAIRTFEPRIDDSSLVVEPQENEFGDGAVRFAIHGDVIAAAHPMPVTFTTAVDPDTAAVEISG
ncbi:type VI secretion system baseplate subunit TssE [Sphingomonas jatrophae]|uniref:Type VI secretion system protein ImpF n=1 Tax=Sphingomonas jatrophae TaxID=1166337 RepID=A0A1I6LK66_9SPHN|nr:type VI secretion system baseplate subunit TssE [Sphingomonas jatrophae]SFS03761.1 type VI secretion system protein ImpF [Sphingomonas jatrophae]